MNNIKYRTGFSSVVLIFFLAIIFRYGKFKGQIITKNPTFDNSNAIFLVITACILFFIIGVYKKVLITKIKYGYLIILFCLNILTIALFTQNPIDSVRQAIGVILSIVIILEISIYFHSIPFEKGSNIVILISIIISILSIYVHTKYVGPLRIFSHSLYDRLGGIFYYTHFAMIMSVSGLLSINSLFSNKHNGFQNFLHITNYIFSTAMILLTDTRSAILPFFLSTILVFIFRWKYLKHSTKYLLSIIIVLFLVFSIYYVFNTSTGKTSESSSEYRIKIWSISIKGVLAKPLTGYGKDSFFRNNSEAINFNRNLADPHNSYIDHALYYGLISLCIFLFILAKIGTSIIKSEKSSYFSIWLYFIITPFFWGGIYHISGGYVQFLFLIIFFGLLEHPDIHKAIYDKC
jgi:O-antigen ligase